MEHQDWKTVAWSKKPGIDKVKKNKDESKKSSDVKTAQLLSDATDAMPLAKISKFVAQQIIDGRCAKKLTRSALAKQINEKESVIADYETCTVNVNQQILNKIGRALGIKILKQEKKK